MRSRWKLPGLLIAGLVGGILTTTAPADATELPVITPAPQSIRRLGPDLPSARSGLTVVKETGTPSPRAAAALAAWSLPAPKSLKPGGYVLGLGTYQGERLAIVVGRDAAGTFYGGQTLAQLTTAAELPSVAIVDEPAFALRGGMESFYGRPWRHEDLLNHLDFLGRHRMNAFLYTVTGDPHTAGAKWREPYTGDDVGRFREAYARARANHVEFVYRVNPRANAAAEAGICHSRQSEKDTLLRRYEQLWDLGGRVFGLGWDDIAWEFTCPEDDEIFGGGEAGLAAAQAHVLNDVYDRFIRTHPGARLVTVPTDYAGTHGSTYRTEFARRIPADVDIFWTGREVVSPTITKADAAAASTAFGGRKLLVFDNYPVNDFSPMSQYLGPLTGRDAALPEHVSGILLNEMQEAEASLISLATAGEYAWNPASYNPQAAWDRSLAEFGGAVADKLRRYAEVHTGSPLSADSSEPLTPLVRAFVDAYRRGGDLNAPGTALVSYLQTLEQVPAALRSGLDNPSFLADSEQWFTKTEQRSRAGIAAVRALQAKASGDVPGYQARREEMASALATGFDSLALAVPGSLDDLLDLAGSARGADALRNDDGSLSVYQRASTGRIQTTRQAAPGRPWSPLADLPAINAAGRPEVVIRPNGAKVAIVRAADGRLYASENHGAWTRLLDVAVTADPDVVIADDGLINLLVRGSSGQVLTFWESATGWKSDSLDGVSMQGKPAVEITLDGVIMAMVRGSDNRLWNAWQLSTGGDWSGWVPVAGTQVASDPDLVRWYDGTFHAFYRGLDNGVYTSWQPTRGGAFTTPATRLGGITAQGNPDAGLENYGGMSLFVRGSDNAPWTMWQYEPRGNWRDGWLTNEQRAHSDLRWVDTTEASGTVVTTNSTGRLQLAQQYAPGSPWSWTTPGAAQLKSAGKVDSSGVRRR